MPRTVGRAVDAVSRAAYEAALEVGRGALLAMCRGDAAEASRVVGDFLGPANIVAANIVVRTGRYNALLSVLLCLAVGAAVPGCRGRPRARWVPAG
ncbi:MAG: hypothetical protein ACRDTG_29125 [Pseudonocardiaceae bacterium]